MATGALVVAHADDLLIAASEKDMELEFITIGLDKVFKVKWGATMSEDWTKFLGRQLRRRGDKIFARVPDTCYNAVLAEHGFEQCRPLSIPCVAQRTVGNEDPLTPEQARQFRRIVGRLMWVAPERLYLAFAVKELARHVQGPTEQHRGVMKRLLRYIKGTVNAQLELKLIDAPETEVCAVVGASWASGQDCRSTSGGTLWLAGWPIGHWSRTAQSTCEAELMAINTGASEAKLVQSVLQELGVQAAVRVESVLSSAVMVTARRGFGRLRHVRVRQLWLQEETRAGRIVVEHISGDSNVADLQTKALPTALFRTLVEQMGVCFEKNEMAMIERKKWNELRWTGRWPMKEEDEKDEKFVAPIERWSVTHDTHDTPQRTRCRTPMKLRVTEIGQASWCCRSCSETVGWMTWQARHHQPRVHGFFPIDLEMWPLGI